MVILSMKKMSVTESLTFSIKCHKIQPKEKSVSFIDFFSLYCGDNHIISQVVRFSYTTINIRIHIELIGWISTLVVFSSVSKLLLIYFHHMVLSYGCFFFPLSPYLLLSLPLPSAFTTIYYFSCFCPCFTIFGCILDIMSSMIAL